MPIKVQGDLPAKTVIERENIFIMDETRAMSQDIRSLNIIVLNLMPMKEETEIQLLRALSNTPLQVDLTLMFVESHVSKNTPQSHINKFYTTFSEIKNKKFDGLIITGAPVEQMEFEEVNYWDELVEIMEWSKTNVTSTFHICWGAQAGLYYHYGVEKYNLDKKVFGVFKHKALLRKVPLLRGFDDVFFAPHSRHTAINEDQVNAHPDLTVLSDSEEVGHYIIMAEQGKQIFVIGHSEYDRMTLDGEYRRDLEKGLDIQVPCNYYENDDPNSKPLLTWRSNGNCLYSNWLNYYVYQATPYDL